MLTFDKADYFVTMLFSININMELFILWHQKKRLKK